MHNGQKKSYIFQLLSNAWLFINLFMNFSNLIANKLDQIKVVYAK